MTDMTKAELVREVARLRAELAQVRARHVGRWTRICRAMRAAMGARPRVPSVRVAPGGFWVGE
jgi:hypothetical protein